MKELPDALDSKKGRPSASRSERAPVAAAPRTFGQFLMKRQLGRSRRAVIWLADCPRLEQEVVLVIARSPVSGAMAVQDWLLSARQAARVTHPNLAHPIEAAVQEHQPYIVVDRALGVTLSEHLGSLSAPPRPHEVVGWVCQILQGLAFAHDAGVAWAELQLEQVVISPSGVVRLMPYPSTPWDSMGSPRAAGIPQGQSASELLRGRTQANVLAVGLLLHRLLAGRFALEEPDLQVAIDRMQPLGPEVVRLPSQTPHAIPEALRVIVNRATAGHSLQRYLSARTLLGALQGWLESQADGASNPIRAVMSRAEAVGILPAQPVVNEIRAALDGAEGCHVEALSAPILHDIALSLAVLQRVNSAQKRWSDGDDAVISMRRAVALLGAKGLAECLERLHAWPGTMDADTATSLQQAMVRSARTAAVACSICPAGYDSEVVHLVASLQGLGRLLVLYHYPAYAEQIRQLMRPVPPQAHEPPGAQALPGLSEPDAVHAVLGISLSELGGGVVKSMGLGDELSGMLRPWDAERSPKASTSDTDVLRAAACAANESVEAWTHLPMSQHPSALNAICQRYGRVLDLGPTKLGEALSGAWLSIRDDGVRRNSAALN